MTKGLTVRHASRGVVWTPEGQALVIVGTDPATSVDDRYIWTPGGGIDPGESGRDALIRELWEEVGHQTSTDRLGPEILHRTGEFSFDGRPLRQIETYYSVPVTSAFEPTPQGWEDLEIRSIHTVEWRTTAQLRESPEAFYPWCLADLVDHLVDNGPPAEPWSEEQRYGES